MPTHRSFLGPEVPVTGTACWFGVSSPAKRPAGSRKGRSARPLTGGEANTRARPRGASRRPRRRLRRRLPGSRPRPPHARALRPPWGSLLWSGNAAPERPSSSPASLSSFLADWCELQPALSAARKRECLCGNRVSGGPAAPPRPQEEAEFSGHCAVRRVPGPWLALTVCACPRLSDFSGPQTWIHRGKFKTHRCLGLLPELWFHYSDTAQGCILKKSVMGSDVGEPQLHST